MTLIKSLLLGSAAGIVAVASAQAADLPTKKGAPAAEYVKICSITVAGKPVVGFTIPGSDTCLKFSGYVTGQIEGGNLATSQSLDYTPIALGGTGAQTANSSTNNRSSFGFTTRMNFAADAVSNTSYGPLAAHMEIQIDNGNGFDNTGNSAYINLAYVTWAGITAGRAPSFFAFTGGGAGWANFMSPDMQGFNQPDVLAYTASFGGGFSATLALQSAGFNSDAIGYAGINGGQGGGTNYSNLGSNYYYGGMQSPDVVANLKVSQGWGSAQISGAAHQVNAISGLNTATQNTWGWALDAGVSFNLPTLGAGDQFLLTGAYSRNAIIDSGLVDAMWGEGGAVNGNGQQMSLADTYWNGSNWQTPTAWSISAEFDHHFNEQFSLSLEGSYGGVNWGNGTSSSMVSNGTSWLVGGVAHWDPVKNLDFEFELLYQNTHNSTPNGFIAGTGAPGGTNVNFNGDADGFAARFEVTRSW